MGRPKGSKNKTKVYEARIKHESTRGIGNTILDLPSESCTVCGRVPFGEIQPLGHDKWRHDSCYPGSCDWAEYYRVKPVKERTEAGNLLLQYFDRREA